MFDEQVDGSPAAMPDAAVTLSLVSAAHRDIVEQECRLVELARIGLIFTIPTVRRRLRGLCQVLSRADNWAVTVRRRYWSSLPPSWLPRWKLVTGRRGR